MEALAQEWGMALLRGAGGGLLLAAVAYATCRFLPRLTAPVRFWLWWLVTAKLVIGLAFAIGGVAALRVPVFSAEHFYRIRRLATRTTVKTVRTVAAHVPVVRKPHRRLPPPVVSGTQALPQKGYAPAVAVSPHLTISHQQRTSVLHYLYSGLILLYLLGMTVLLGRTLWGSFLLRRLLSTARPAEDTELLSEMTAVAERLRLKRMPRLLLSSETTAPLVTGLIDPAIVLPCSVAEASPALRRMALAHEMAHLQRGDLWLAVIPTLARILFWFMPVVHLVAREMGVAREEACDLIAVRVCETSPATYGSLLISVAARQRTTLPTAALGMASATSPGFAQVKRRLKTLQREATGVPIPRLWRGVALTLLITQGTVTLLPLRPSLAGAAFAARVTLPSQEPLPRYLLTDLGTLGGRHSGAFAVNDMGVVVGMSNVYPLGERGHAFLHDGKTMHDIAAGSIYRHSQALSVSDTGMVAGVAFRSSYRTSEQVAFVWNGKRRVYLSPTSGFHFARANGVNDTGVVVGASLSGTTDAQGATVAHATLWQGSDARDLGTLGGRYSQALAVAANGLVVGKADTADDDSGNHRTHPFVYDGDTMRDLGTLGGANGSACAVGDSGIIVGYAEMADGTVHAFAADARHEDGLRDLGTLPGYTTSEAFGVSRTGAIVGQAAASGLPSRALYWRRPGTTPIDLNELLTPDAKAAGWQLEQARGINAQGWIVGQGLVNGHHHAFLLTPVGR